MLGEGLVLSLEEQKSLPSDEGPACVQKRRIIRCLGTPERLDLDPLFSRSARLLCALEVKMGLSAENVAVPVCVRGKPEMSVAQLDGVQHSSPRAATTHELSCHLPLLPLPRHSE